VARRTTSLNDCEPDLYGSELYCSAQALKTECTECTDATCPYFVEAELSIGMAVVGTLGRRVGGAEQWQNPGFGLSKRDKNQLIRRSLGKTRAWQGLYTLGRQV
jgi:hypothetical protein